MAEPRFRFPLKDNSYRVIDGDTVEVTLDTGWKGTKVVSCRILGTDAPESNTRKNLYERKVGALVTKVVSKWLGARWQSGQLFSSSEHRPKYANRTVGRIWLDEIDDELSAFLLEGGFVRAYSGGKRLPWEDEELRVIEANCLAYLGPDAAT